MISSSSTHACSYCAKPLGLIPFAEGARLIGWTPGHLDKIFHRGQSGDMPQPIRFGKARYFRAAELLRWLDGQANGASSETPAHPPSGPRAASAPLGKGRGRPPNTLRTATPDSYLRTIRGCGKFSARCLRVEPEGVASDDGAIDAQVALRGSPTPSLASHSKKRR